MVGYCDRTDNIGGNISLSSWVQIGKKVFYTLYPRARQAEENRDNPIWVGSCVVQIAEMPSNGSWVCRVNRQDHKEEKVGKLQQASEEQKAVNLGNK